MRYHKPTRRILGGGCILFLVAAGGVALYVNTTDRALGGPRSHGNDLILVVIDTVRADDFGCYGNDRRVTPNIDALARDGVLFDQAFSHSPWTLPSVASLLTSTYPTIHGAVGKGKAMHRFSIMRRSAVSGVEALHDAGFKTHAIVNNQFLDENYGFSRGFDEYDIDYATNAQVRRADENVTAALEWLRENRRQRKFLMLHLIDPHLRYDPPAAFASRFAPTYRGPLRTTPPKALDVLTERMMRGEYIPPPDDREYLHDMHLAELAFVDEQLGRFFSELRKLGLYEHSTIAVTADHGEEFWDHGHFEHGHSLYDELIRLPLIIKPAVATGAISATTQGMGRVIPSQVRQIDVMPSMLALVGVKPPESFQGESFDSVFYGTASSLTPRDVFSEEPLYQPLALDTASGKIRPVNELIALRSNGYKYILDLNSGRDWLFHVKHDPAESADLVGSEPQVAAEMRRRALAQSRLLLEQAKALGPARVFDMHEGAVETLASMGYIREAVTGDPATLDAPPEPTKLEKVIALERITP